MQYSPIKKLNHYRLEEVMVESEKIPFAYCNVQTTSLHSRVPKRVVGKHKLKI